MPVHRTPLDDVTADRLAGGSIDPADAPPGFVQVAEVLAELRSAPFAASDPDPALLGAMVRAIHDSPRPTRTLRMSRFRTTKVATIAAAVVLSTAGVAAAATGTLPDPAQDAVSDAASHVGVDLPAAHDDHPTGNIDNPTERDDHGVDVSETARTTEASGRDHGRAVSEVARDEHGRDDDTTSTTEATEDDDDATHGHRPDDAGKPEDPGTQAPVATPDGGGTGTADEASHGHSSAGTSHASDRAGEGSGNADDHASSSGRSGSNRGSSDS
jgi:hypothetical protein